MPPHSSPVGQSSEQAFPDITISAAGYSAAISSIGGTLRALSHGGRDLVVPFARNDVRPLYRGAVLIPWPNRIADGRYTFAGRTYQLPINEVERGHALHGLVQWEQWQVTESHPNAVTLQHQLVPQDGYPFPLLLRLVYTLDDQGLTALLTATNIGRETAPYGCSTHPYLVADGGIVDDWQLGLPAGRRLEVNDRLIPRELVPVDRTDTDFRRRSVIGSRKIDHAFTGLTRGADGRATVELVDPRTGRGVAVSWEAWAPWVQVHTADRPEPDYHRRGLAIEPMSCPPNAFNDTDAPVLAAGESHTAEWRITAIDAA